MKNSLVILLLFLCSCVTTPSINVTNNLTPVSIPTPTPMVLDKSITWALYSVAQFKSEVRTTFPDKEMVLFTLTPDEYTKLSRNILELSRYIEEQKATIAFLTKIVNQDRPTQSLPEKLLIREK